MKKVSIFMMALVLIAACMILLPTEAQAASISDLTFTLNSDGESYSVTGCKETAKGGLTIPDTYNGKPVTAIGENAFCYSQLADIRIPYSVTTIGSFAFCYCYNLYVIEIPSSITSIGYDAFLCCNNLDPITIPNSVNSIGYSAFQGCSVLTSITIPDGVTEIGISTFKNCDSLRSITIPDSVTSIGEDAFLCCDNLTEVYYTGTQAQWNSLAVDSGNNPIKEAELILVQDSSVVMDGSFDITSWGANVWSKPYTSGDSRIIDTYSLNKSLIIIGKVTNTSGDVWYQLLLGGWIYAGNGTIHCYPTDVEAYNRSATVIDTSGAEVGSLPESSNDSHHVYTAAYRSKLTVIGKVYNAAGYLWYQLSDGNWVYSGRVRITDYDPADVEAINKTLVVTSWGANIWSKPYSSGDSQVIKTVEKSAALNIVAQVRNSTYGLWYQLSDGGWVYSHNVTERLYDPAKVIAYKRSATVIVPGGVNIWGQPVTSAPSTVARTAAYQTKLNVVAKYTTPAGGLWYQLTDGNWVYSSNVRITDYDPADIAFIDSVYVVTSWGANIWSKPYSSGDSQVVKTVDKAAALHVVAEVRNSTGGLWYRITDGWVYSKSVTERLYNPDRVSEFKRSATVTATGGANIWSQPSTYTPSKVARVAARNTKLNIVAKYSVSGGLWYQLSDGNWVYGDNILVTDYDPADVVAYKKNVIVTSASAYIWTRPYSSGNSNVYIDWNTFERGYVEKGDILSVVGKVKNSTGSLWYKLANGGWVYSGNVALTTGYYHAADEIEIGESHIITSWSGKIWTKPYTQGDSECLGMLKKGTVWYMVTKVTNYAGGTWYKIFYDIGYIANGAWIYAGNVAPTTETSTVYENDHAFIPLP